MSEGPTLASLQDLSRSIVSRRTLLRTVGGGVALSAVGGLLADCGGGKLSSTQAASTQAAASTSAASTSAASTSASGPSASPTSLPVANATVGASSGGGA